MSQNLVEPLYRLVLPSLSTIGFHEEHAISALSRAVLLSRATSRTCAYFILRERGGTVWAELRLAPPQFPDDRLQNLPGYCLELGQCHDFANDSSEFLRNTVQRTMLIAPNVVGLTTAIETELFSPIFQVDETHKYALAMTGYEELRKTMQLSVTPSLVHAIEVAKEVVQGNQPEDHLASACVPLVKETRSVVNAFRDPIFQGKARLIGRLIAPHFYIDAVVGSDWPIS
jgi:hypothetical protein